MQRGKRGGGGKVCVLCNLWRSLFCLGANMESLPELFLQLLRNSRDNELALNILPLMLQRCKTFFWTYIVIILKKKNLYKHAINFELLLVWIWESWIWVSTDAFCNISTPCCIQENLYFCYFLLLSFFF